MIYICTRGRIINYILQRITVKFLHILILIPVISSLVSLQDSTRITRWITNYIDQEIKQKEENLNSPMRKALKRSHYQANSIDDSLLRCDEKRISSNNIANKDKNKRERKILNLQNKENLNFDDKPCLGNSMVIPVSWWGPHNKHKRHKSGINSSIYSNDLLFDSHCDEFVEISCSEENLDKDLNKLSYFSISSPNKDKSSIRHIHDYSMQNKMQNFWLADSDLKSKFLKPKFFKDSKSFASNIKEYLWYKLPMNFSVWL